MDLAPSELEAILHDPEARRFHAVRLALASHRLTPRADALSLVETLFSYDLAHLSADVRANPELRRAADRLLLRRASDMALAERMHLARPAGRGMHGALRPAPRRAGPPRPEGRAGYAPGPPACRRPAGRRRPAGQSVRDGVGRPLGRRRESRPRNDRRRRRSPPLERAAVRPGGASRPPAPPRRGSRAPALASDRRGPVALERLARRFSRRSRSDAKNPCAQSEGGLASSRIKRLTNTIQVQFRRMANTRPSGPSFGDELRRERVVREVSLEEISAATKISLRLLSALERSDLVKLPAPVFTRGFIRAYCLHLGLDPVDKINAYLAVVQTGDAPSTSGKPGLGSRFLRGRRSTAGTILGGVTAVLLLLGLIASPDRRRPDSARSSVLASVEPVSFKNVSPSNEPTPLIREDAPEMLSAEGAIALVLDFDESSWVEISADGEKVFDGLVTAGASRRFEAQKGFRVTLGNAGGVRVSVDGRPEQRLGRPGQVVRNVVLPDSPSRG